MGVYNKAAASIPSPASICAFEVGYSRQRTASPTQTLEGHHIHLCVGMDDSTYIPTETAHMHDTLSVGSPHSQDTHSSATQSTSVYGSQDLTGSYTASVTPFSPYPSYDTSLPTPISVTGSPSLSERSHKMPPTYNQHEGPQALTPPEGARQWPYPGMTGAPTASMTVPSTSAEMLNMQSLHSSQSPEQHPTAPDPTPHFHWGQYTVSDQSANDDMSQSHSMFNSNVTPSLLVRSPPQYGLSHVPLAPAVPHGSMPSHVTGAQPLMPQDLHPQYQNLSNISLEYGQAYPSRSRAKSGRTERPPKRGRKPATNMSGSSGDGYGSASAEAVSAHAHMGKQASISVGSPRMLALDPKAPEDCRFLVEMRSRMSVGKGKDMWNQIQQAYHERFGGELKTKENLQMLLIRTVQKYAIWPDDEIRALKAAVEKYERNRYSEIRRIMKEEGGRRVWDWNQGCIAKQLVMLGIDEIDHSFPKKVRRRRKHAVRESTGGEAWTACDNLQYNTQLRELTGQEEESIIESFYNPDTGSPRQVESMTEHLPASSSGGGRVPRRSQDVLVARQARDEMMSRQDEKLYGDQGRYGS
ncbi:hypothetical protein GGS20DRAFT_148249 [Poronia punctata]|nr:hypothetical protein GGS20DRAFT_148249 [Poronia punctata]